jgi:hypothetical protein
MRSKDYPENDRAATVLKAGFWVGRERMVG